MIPPVTGTGMIAAMHADAIAMLPGTRLAVAARDAEAYAAACGHAAEPDLSALLARRQARSACAVAWSPSPAAFQ